MLHSVYLSARLSLPVTLVIFELTFFFANFHSVSPSLCSVPVYPYITSCSSTWSSTYVSKLNKIYYPRKQAVQAVTNSDYRAHTAPLFSKLEILDIFQINALDIARFKLRYRNNLLPPLFFNLFMTNSQVHRYDTSRTAGNYRVHSCRTNIKKFTILHQGPRVWNCLPASITNLSSFPTFMNKVLKFLLK